MHQLSTLKSKAWWQAFLVAAILTSSAFAWPPGKTRSDLDDPLYNSSAPQFNEQGLIKGGSFRDHGEIQVNEFNGNLIWRRDLYHFEGEGGFDLSVGLAYNGSVSHSIITNLRYYSVPYNNALVSPLGINTPEWILSVNGIGVQVFNFETDMYNWVSYPGASTATKDSVACLVDGYHRNVHVTEGSAHPRGYLRLLMADGSTEVIFNDTDIVLDDGRGRGDRKVSFWKYWSRRDTTDHYKEFWVKPGDGTTVYGRTHFVSYRNGLQESCPGFNGNIMFVDTIGVFVPD